MKRKLKRNLTNEIYTYLPIISLTYLIHHLHCALLHYTSINNSSLLDYFQTGKKNENKILSLLFASKYLICYQSNNSFSTFISGDLVLGLWDERSSIWGEDRSKKCAFKPLCFRLVPFKFFQ